LKDLLEKSKNGDISSFMELIRQKQNLIYKIAWNYAENPSDVEDCISDATIKAYDNLHQLKDDTKFYAWYISILINKCRYYSRKSKRQVPLEDDNAAVLADSNSFECIEDKMLFKSILSSLEGRPKDILVLKYLEGFTLKEIAFIMKVPQSTVKSILYRALNKLR
jgi:RNA polymerase sigma-70 factor (ECF subfamily)